MKLYSVPSFTAGLITLGITRLPSNAILEKTASIPFDGHGICGIEDYSTVCNAKQEVGDCIYERIVGGAKIICGGA